MCYFSCQAQKITISRDFVSDFLYLGKSRMATIVGDVTASSSATTHKIYLILLRRSKAFLSTEGKIVSKYCNIISKLWWCVCMCVCVCVRGGGGVGGWACVHPPPLYHGGVINLRLLGLMQGNNYNTIKIKYCCH